MTMQLLTMKGHDNPGYHNTSQDLSDLDDDSFLSDLERNSARSSIQDSAREETRHSRRHDMLQAISEGQLNQEAANALGMELVPPSVEGSRRTSTTERRVPQMGYGFPIAQEEKEDNVIHRLSDGRISLRLALEKPRRSTGSSGHMKDSLPPLSEPAVHKEDHGISSSPIKIMERGVSEPARGDNHGNKAGKLKRAEGKIDIAEALDSLPFSSLVRPQSARGSRKKSQPQSSFERNSESYINQQTHKEVQQAPKPTKPEARLSNMFGLIDLRKLTSLIGDKKQPKPSPAMALEPGGLEHFMELVTEGERLQTEEEPNNVEHHIPQSPTNRRHEKGLEIAGMVGFLSLVLLVIAHCSPYWLVSWDDTQSPFVNLGVWMACFRDFRFPHYQFDKLFNGCYQVWGIEYRQIREWLVPPWLISVEMLLVISLVCSFFGRLLSTAVLLRYPIKWFLRFSVQILIVATTVDLVIGFALSVGITVFAFCCWSRSWLLYPNFNYLSWGWVMALLSAIGHFLSAILHWIQSVKARKKEEENRNFLLQLEPSPMFTPDADGIYI